MKYLTFIVWAGVVYCVGVALFAGGFLLTKATLSQRTETAQKSKPLFRKAIIIIIDALKYEFTVFNSSIIEEKPYQNKLPIIDRLVNSGYGRLLESLADPPTTTLQRLKALTTGSLPTFVDIGNNFASSEITEDNWIDQLVRNDKKIVFTGDDTWVGLFPNRFHRAFPFPSFDVWDLDSVDTRVSEVLRDEIRHREDWDVFIGHYLGVDHCGHKFGPNHGEMSRKLREMDDVINFVSKEMPEDSVLFVLGDHGMTMTGDHGGDSHDEISAALFMYNKRYKFQDLSNDKVVSQIDFVPTFCALMGLPIPFSNLGSVLDRDLIPVKASHHLKSNLDQVMSYFHAYLSNNSNKFPEFKLRTVFDLYRNFSSFKTEIQTPADISFRHDLGHRFLSEAKTMCQTVWVEFNLSPMRAGLTLIFIHLCLLCLLSLTPPSHLLKIITSELNTFVLASNIIGCALGWLLYFSYSYELMTFVLGTGAFISVMTFGFLLLWKLRNSLISIMKNFFKEDWDKGLLVFVLVLLSLLSSLSNSFVVEEGSVLNFLCVSALIVVFLKNKDIKYAKRVTILAALLVRISNVYFRCREEQEVGWNCRPTHFHKPIGTLPPEISRSFKNWRFFFTIFSVMIVCLIPGAWLKKCGNLNGFSPPVALVNYVPPVLGVSMVFYWALQGLPAQMAAKLLPWQQNILAQFSFGLGILTTSVVLAQPTLVFSVNSKIRSYEVPKLVDSGIQSYFKFMKTNWKIHFNANSSGQQQTTTPSLTVYGLGTGLSAPILAVLTMMCLMSMLILGDGLCPAVALILLSIACLVFISGLSRIKAENPMRVTWDSVILWWLLESLFFYGTGHQPTFPSIQWNAAFVGFSGANYGSDSYLLPTVLVGWNTFVSRILFGLSLPLLLTAPYTISLTFPSLNEKVSSEKGEVIFLERSAETKSQMFYLLTRYLVLQGLRLFFAALSAAILRRHLMVWKIFAPRFIFEGIGFFVSLASVFIGYLLWQRVYSALSYYYFKIKDD